MAGSDYIPFASNVRYNKELGDMSRAMKEGKLGLSESTKEYMAAKEQTAVGKQIGAAQQDIAQEAMASGGQPGGSYTKAMMKMAESTEEAGAKGRRAAEEASYQIAEAKRRETMDRLNEKRRENRALMEETIVKPALSGVGAAAGGQALYGLETLFG